MKNRRILIADDNFDVIKAFKKAIEDQGHTALTCSTLMAAGKILNNDTEEVDIAFIDNHFTGGGFGVDSIEKFKKYSPDTLFVLTTKYTLQPDLVKQVIDLKVGFCSKDVSDPIRLKLEIAQQVNLKSQAESVAKSKFDLIRKGIKGRREGIFRVFNFFNGEGRLEVKTGKVTRKKRKVVFPEFKSVLTVHCGSKVSLKEAITVEVSKKILTTTDAGLGLNISESMKFLETKVGIEMLTKLRLEKKVDTNRILRGSWSKEVDLFISDDDAKNGARRREFFQGVEHVVYEVELVGCCENCNCEILATISVLIPEKIVEVSCTYDKYGKIFNEEDGRAGYHVAQL